MRRLIVVCGDQLDHNADVLADFDPDRDAILMTEAADEATYVPQHKRRLVLFFSAMRHFAAHQRAQGRRVIYRHLGDEGAPETLAESLRSAVRKEKPEDVVMTRPGDWRVLKALEEAAPDLRIVEDSHFISSPQDWGEMRDKRKRFILEDYYRALRKRTGWLMDDDAPVGGAWNLDKDNRKSFGREGPGMTPGRPASAPDDVTEEVIREVERRFGNAPGSLKAFAEPVTRRQALAHLRDFVEHRLPHFGDYQDAIAVGHPTLWHSRISAALNLKLLNPREICEAAIEAYDAGHAPINAVEGFVRQILGWREFSRGVYWTLMPQYAEHNELEAEAALPEFFWTGETDMACLADALGQLQREAYAHHIQRLMVLGLFLMLWGVRPKAANDWHLSMYLDAIDWVSLPNMLGMSQHADGGVMGTKPYCASGAYIDRMSDACRGCRYDPKKAAGADACPFTTLYWDFLDRHEARFAPNMRMKMQINNLRRKDDDQRRAIRKAASALHQEFG